MPRPCTPPLLPLTPPMSPYIPSSPGNQVELASDDSNSTAAEAKALEDEIMTADALVRHDSNGSDVLLFDMAEPYEFDPTMADIDSPSSKRRLSDLKVEGPLTPTMFSVSPAKKLKTVTFAEMLVEYMPTDYEPQLPSLCENENKAPDADDDYDAFFQEVIEPGAQEAKWEVEHEQLSAADTLKRVPVPKVDFTLPLAPWDEFSRKNSNANGTELDAQARYLLSVKRNHMKVMTHWRGLSELDRKLPLAPFSFEAVKEAINQMLKDVELHGADVAAKMIDGATAGDIATSSSGMWKRDGLRILEDEDDEEEYLEPTEFEDGKDMNSLVRKRKLELEENAFDQEALELAAQKVSTTEGYRFLQSKKLTKSHERGHETANNHSSGISSTTKQRSRTENPACVSKKESQAANRDKSLMFGGRFSATSALHNFMALHNMPVTEEEAKIRRASKSRPQSSNRPKEQTSKTTAVSTASPPPASRKSPSLPPLPAHMSPSSFIISSSLLQQRSVSRQIEKLYGTADLVCRDGEHGLNAACHGADLILSPSTGLIISTLQNLKQQALPGQRAWAPVKERIKALLEHYERLVVVVSEGLKPQQLGYDRPVDPRDEEAFADYGAFAAQLDGEVILRYVPGGEEALARCVVCEMASFGLPYGSKDIGDIKLLTETTNWELFLTRAGLNAYAAQIILALLKNKTTMRLPASASQSSVPSSSWFSTGMITTAGLQTFLLMPAEQRVSSFQALLGGSRILARVNRLLDQEWVSAVNGFRV